MKKPSLQAWLLCILSIIQIPSYAFNPVSNTYFGVFLGPTYTPDISFEFNPNNIPSNTISSFKSSLATYLGVPVDYLNQYLNGLTLPNQNIPGTIKTSILGMIGGEVGYRMCQDYRIEGEIFFNNNPISGLTIGNFTINGSNASFLSNESDPNPNFTIDGDLNTAAALLNFLYEVPITNKNGLSPMRPYLGFGLGYAYVFNSLTFKYANTTEQTNDGAEPVTYETTLRRNHSSLAVQGIIGMSYFIDDFCWLSLDARYFTTPPHTSTFQTSGVNFQSKTTLISVLIGFHGALSHG